MHPFIGGVWLKEYQQFNKDPLKKYIMYLINKYGGLVTWPFQELSGSTAFAYSNGPGNYNGSITGATVGQIATSSLGRSYLFDGINDVVDVYTLALASGFNTNAGTMSIFVKPLNVGVWTDATTRFIFNIRADNNNKIDLVKSSINNTLLFEFVYGGTIETLTWSPVSFTGWTGLAITWDKVADEVKYFLNGAQVDVTKTTLGVWAGVLDSIRCVVGAATNAAANPWSGWLTRPLLLTSAATPAEILKLSQLGGVV